MILWSKTDRIAQVGRDAGRSLANLLHKARSVWGQVIQGFIYPHLEILHGLRQYDSLWTQMQDLYMVCKVLWVEDLVISLTLLAMLNAAQDVVEFSLLAGRTAGLHAAWSPCPLESFSAVLTLSQFSLHQCQGHFLPKCGFLHLPLHYVSARCFLQAAGWQQFPWVLVVLQVRCYLQTCTVTCRLLMKVLNRYPKIDPCSSPVCSCLPIQTGMSLLEYSYAGRECQKLWDYWYPLPFFGVGLNDL